MRIRKHHACAYEKTKRYRRDEKERKRESKENVKMRSNKMAEENKDNTSETTAEELISNTKKKILRVRDLMRLGKSYKDAERQAIAEIIRDSEGDNEKSKGNH